jgi:YggT family protein
VLGNIFNLIVDTVAGLLAFVLLLRFWMQVIRIRPPATVGQFTFQLTDWLVLRLRRVVPGIGGYDWSSLIGAILVALLAMTINAWLLSAFSVQVILLLTVQRLLSWIIYCFIAILICGAVFSWVNPNAPLAPFVRALNEPLLQPLRRFIPLIGNIDLTPLALLILLQIALKLVDSMMLLL